MPSIEAALEHLRARSLNGPSMYWLALIEECMRGHDMEGGLSNWGSINDSCPVETLQFSFDTQGAPDRITNVWLPGIRTAVWNPNGVRFHMNQDEYSTRRYFGVLTVGSKEQTYVGYDRQMHQVLVYHRVDEPEKV